VYERERLCVCMCDCACVFVTSLMMVDGTQNRRMKRFLVKSDTESRTMDCIFDTDCSEVHVVVTLPLKDICPPSRVIFNVCC